MLPFHWKLGFLAVTPNELFAVLGAAIGGFIARRRLMALGATDGGVLDFVLAALGGGAVGARLYYFLPLWIRGQMSFSQLFSTWSDGSGFYGAFIAGSLALGVTAHFKKIPVLAAWDATMGTVPLGFGIGKIGCFLAGCCYGLPWSAGMRFAPGSLCYVTQRSAGLLPRDAVASLPVVPIQLFEMIFGFALFGCLEILQRRPSKRPGEIFAACAVGYSAYRFVIEFFRADPDRHTFGSSALTDSQYTAIAVFLVAGACWAYLRWRKPAETLPSAPK
ncbi:MAG TPA: prolipoprotein diacylglyceryl transferase family protein [Planctomycetota bacterium]|jgi:phosphatidylglycerol:prolipoprotein diacylglycerol transferase|nr:prolipoprotein diacylglyceryl transferase family protein [Planctomycetota bacterium]